MTQKGKGQILLYTMGFPQRQIADAVPCDPAYVYRCLAGKQKPSKRLIKTACELTGLTAESLFDLKEGA